MKEERFAGKQNSAGEINSRTATFEQIQKNDYAFRFNRTTQK